MANEEARKLASALSVAFDGWGDIDPRLFERVAGGGGVLVPEVRLVELALEQVAKKVGLSAPDAPEPKPDSDLAEAVTTLARMAEEAERQRELHTMLAQVVGMAVVMLRDLREGETLGTDTIKMLAEMTATLDEAAMTSARALVGEDRRAREAAKP